MSKLLCGFLRTLQYSVGRLSLGLSLDPVTLASLFSSTGLGFLRCKMKVLAMPRHMAAVRLEIMFE